MRANIHTRFKGIFVKTTKRQKDIIDASIELIAEKGIQELTIKNLSKKIGIVESAIYRHFKSKMDILLSILSLFRDSKEAMNQELSELSAGASEKLKQMLQKRFTFFAANPAIAAVIFSEELFRNDRRLSDFVYKIMQYNQQVIVSLLENGQKSGEFRDDVAPKELAFMITGALRLVVTQWRIAEYSFDLLEEGECLWKTIEVLIKK